MKVLDAIKGMIYKSDLFCSGSLLRIKGEPQHQTLLGGMVSISAMVLLFAAFSNKIIDTLNKQIITSSTIINNAEDPLPYSLTTIDNGPFMFGVEIWHHNLNEGNRYFDLVLLNTIYSFGEVQNTSISIPLEPCTREHWNGYPQTQNKYEDLHIDYWMCPPKNMSFEIKGKYASAQSKSLDIYVQKCMNSTFNSRQCAPQAEIDQFFIDHGDSLYFTVYFLNPLINADSEIYLSYYLEDSNYIIFSQNGGGEALVFVQDYEISTDLSIFPNSDLLVEKGGIVTGNAIKNSFTKVIDTYAAFTFFKSPISTVHSRQFQKLDDVFSYIGGLLGTILFTFFIVSAYNTYKFQINFAGYLYRSENQGEKIQSSYNFLYYLGQCIYALLRMLKFRPNWQKLSYYYETREQMLKQLDILYLLKRVAFLERSLSFLFTDHQLKGIYLSSQCTIAEAIHMRRNHKLKERLKESIEGHNHQGNKNHNEANQLNLTHESMSKKQSNELKHQKGRNTKKNDQTQNKLFDGEFYSSEESSSDQEEQSELQFIKKLKKEQINNVVSKKIWNNIDARLLAMIQPLFSKVEAEKQNNFQYITNNLKNQNQNQVNNILVYINPIAQSMSSEQHESCVPQQTPTVMLPKPKNKINNQS